MHRHPLIESELSHDIIGAFYEVYNVLGFGFLLHFGPEPKFYRVISTNHPLYPPDPAEPSDLDLRVSPDTPPPAHTSDRST